MGDGGISGSKVLTVQQRRQAVFVLANAKTPGCAWPADLPEASLRQAYRYKQMYSLGHGLLFTKASNLRVLDCEQSFDAIRQVHTSSNHFAARNTHRQLCKTYVGVTKAICQLYIDLCPSCQRKKNKKSRKRTRGGGTSDYAVACRFTMCHRSDRHGHQPRYHHVSRQSIQVDIGDHRSSLQVYCAQATRDETSGRGCRCVVRILRDDRPTAYYRL